jgi:hypothetical protein
MILRRSSVFLVLAGLLFVVMASNRASAGLTYSWTNFASLQNGWTVSGSITTDGTIGGLLRSNITAWDYTATNGVSTFTGASTTSGAFLNNFTNIGADSTNLFVNGMDGDLMLVADGSYSNLINWSYLFNNYNAQVPAGTKKWDTNPSGQYVDGKWAIASRPAPVPEIDPATGGSALSLVAGVLAMIEQRRRRATLVA